jgi:hypothetical protein
MKKRILALLVAAFASGTSVAQVSHDFGYGMGISSYLGDLESKAYTWENPNFGHSAFFRQNFGEWFSIKEFISVMRISGADSKDNIQSHINRNLSFRSDIIEVGGVMEINFIPFAAYNAGGSNPNRQRFTPYASIGLNAFYFNPKTLYKGEWIELQPLNTEGQGSSFNNTAAYNRFQMAVPMSIGAKIQYRRHTWALDIGFRKTFTDYLDDVSGAYADQTKLTSEKGYLAAELAYRTDELVGYEGTKPVAGTMRGDSANDDWYLFNSITYSFKFGGARTKAGSTMKKQ